MITPENIHTIYANGDQEWYQCGNLHRADDLPAVIRANGTQMWYQHGELHRDNDLPAQIEANGDRQWYHHGVRHRCGRCGGKDNDLPAYTCANGDQFWFQYGKAHRDNDLPAVIFANGGQLWFQHGIQLCPAKVEDIHTRRRERLYCAAMALTSARTHFGAKNKYLPRELTRIILQFATPNPTKQHVIIT